MYRRVENVGRIKDPKKAKLITMSPKQERKPLRSSERATRRRFAAELSLSPNVASQPHLSSTAITYKQLQCQSWCHHHHHRLITSLLFFSLASQRCFYVAQSPLRSLLSASHHPPPPPLRLKTSPFPGILQPTSTRSPTRTSTPAASSSTAQSRT